MHDPLLFRDILFLLLAAIIAVPLFQALRIPAVLGYLVAGMALGPHTPGPVVDLEMPQILAEFGVVFLLFAIGLELPLSRLQAMRRYIFGLGLMQVFFTSAIIGAIGYGFGLTPEAAIVTGGMLAFSSTATVLKLLVERGETVARFGRISVAVLIFQDLAVVPLLTLLPLLAGESTSIPYALGLAGVKAVAAILVIMLLGRFVVRPAYRFVASANSPEVFTAANLFVLLAIGWLTAEAGMSMALGAFLAGMLLADTPYRHQVEADIEPFRGLLLGLFFMTVGMTLDLPAMADRADMILLVTVSLLAGKSTLLFLLCRLSGLGLATSLRIGLLLAQGGEFAFVLIGKATALKVMDGETGLLLSSSVALSMAVTPLIGTAAQRLAQAIEARRGAETFGVEADGRTGHVLIAGYGRVGAAVARLLAAHDVPFLALDLEPQRVARARQHGLPVYYGDASQEVVLRVAGIERARAAVITLNRPERAERAVEAIRRAAPDLPIVARAHDLGQRGILSAAGATAVVPETIEASLHMAALVLRKAGIDPQTVDRNLQAYRDGNYEALMELETKGKEAAGAD
ncbi:monovalent cation:proton antiporter-2 (CPA2) family protein [Azospirillum thermophilum]|uniref:Potassium transporter KefB n=1 Tax=Azospirillum thermophilum TaxID=2202148 RepID=A0A2S2CX61_9PROT|nr:monovalent cation:proton antiporter-2 (CPA2) family protein [Azospirillum thermophilum]AWK88867.1 potassium transporter KefB [Azospirillum thermophilum]